MPRPHLPRGGRPGGGRPGGARPGSGGPGGARPGEAEAQAALDQAARPRRRSTRQAEAQEASDCAALAHAAASKTFPEPPLAETMNLLSPRFGFGALVIATALATSTTPTPTESGAAPRPRAWPSHERALDLVGRPVRMRGQDQRRRAGDDRGCERGTGELHVAGGDDARRPLRARACRGRRAPGRR